MFEPTTLESVSKLLHVPIRYRKHCQLPVLAAGHFAGCPNTDTLPKGNACDIEVVACRCHSHNPVLHFDLNRLPSYNRVRLRFTAIDKPVLLTGTLEANMATIHLPRHLHRGSNILVNAKELTVVDRGGTGDMEVRTYVNPRLLVSFGPRASRATQFLHPMRIVSDSRISTGPGRPLTSKYALCLARNEKPTISMLPYEVAERAYNETRRT